MNTSPKHPIKILLRNGFILVRIKGSHHIYFNQETNNNAIVPVHGRKDLKLGSFLGILKDAGLDKSNLN